MIFFGDKWSDMTNEVSLDKIAHIQQGQYLSPKEMAMFPNKEAAIPVWGANGIIGFTNKASYEKSVPLVTCRGNGCGLVQWTKGPAHISNNAMTILPKSGSESDNRYLYYTLLNSDFSDVTTGSAQPQITVGHLKRKVVYWGEPPEYRRTIAHILGTLDDKIELNRRMNETLEAMAQALFKSWFVDFDPVRAKMEGRPTGLPKEIEDLFPDSFEDSELGEIPRGWKASPFDQLITEVNEKVGGRHVPEYSSTNNGLQLRSERFKKNLSISISNNKIIRRGCLIFGLSRQVLNFGLMRNEIGCISPAYKVFSINETMVEPDFVERVMRLKPNYYFGAVSASSREGQSISAEGLKRLKFVLPYKPLQTIFYEITAPIQNHLLFLQKEAETLIQIRDFLLPKLLSGEIRVTHLEKILEQTL